MAATKKEFNKLRNRLLYDERFAEGHPPFGHDKRFREKVKENWLTTEEFGELKNASLFELTQALIDKKMDSEYFDEIMKLIDAKEPNYIAGEKGLNYIKLVSKTPIENMKRVYEKYDNLDYFIKRELRNGLELLILNKSNGQNRH